MTPVCPTPDHVSLLHRNNSFPTTDRALLANMSASGPAGTAPPAPERGSPKAAPSPGSPGRRAEARSRPWPRRHAPRTPIGEASQRRAWPGRWTTSIMGRHHPHPSRSSALLMDSVPVRPKPAPITSTAPANSIGTRPNRQAMPMILRRSAWIKARRPARRADAG